MTQSLSFKINNFQNYYNSKIKNETRVDLAIVLSVVAIMILKCPINISALSLHYLISSCQWFWCAKPLNHLIIPTFS